MPSIYWNFVNWKSRIEQYRKKCTKHYPRNFPKRSFLCNRGWLRPPSSVNRHEEKHHDVVICIKWIIIFFGGSEEMDGYDKENILLIRLYITTQQLSCFSNTVKIAVFSVYAAYHFLHCFFPRETSTLIAHELLMNTIRCGQSQQTVFCCASTPAVHRFAAHSFCFTPFFAAYLFSLHAIPPTTLFLAVHHFLLKYDHCSHHSPLHAVPRCKLFLTAYYCLLIFSFVQIGTICKTFLVSFLI